MLASIGVDLPTAILLVLALGLALGFEFVNGFHDTANAVATVIYTNSLKPAYAVVWSGCWNLIGVLTSSGAVAFGIVALLPVELVINVGSGAGFAMVFSLLLSAIIWNLGTWYLGLPASSSHTLIGSIVGVGLMNSIMSPDSAFGDGINWGKVQDTVKALVLSPLIGFVVAGLCPGTSCVSAATGRGDGALVMFGALVLAQLLYGNRLVYHLGAISYSIYLMHQLFVSFTVRTARHFGATPLAYTTCVAVALAVIWLLSWLSYRYVEMPGRKFLIALLQPKKEVAPKQA